jgi:hypothetical protein
LSNYGAQAEALLEKRAQIWEQRKALTDSLTGEPSAEQRSQLDQMDTDLNRLGAEARSIVEEGERERDAAELRQRAIALGAKPGVFTGDQQPQAQSGPSLSDEIRALTLPGQVLTIGQDIYMKPGQEARAALAAAETRVATTGSAANAGPPSRRLSSLGFWSTCSRASACGSASRPSSPPVRATR